MSFTLKYFKTMLCLTLCLPLNHLGAQQIGKKIHINPFYYNIQKEVKSESGIVACAHPLAALVGKDILLQGGNAIDAAIAVQLVLAVVYPEAGNLGGGGFMVATLNNKKIAIDFRETAPGKAREDMYLNQITHKPIDGLSTEGILSSGVPGTVAGIFATIKYARLPLATLIDPAIEIADKGFVITEGEAANLNSTATHFRKENKTLPVFVKQSGQWKAGDTLIQKELAHTLLRIKRQGMAGFYGGETAKMIVSEMKKSGGIISYEDLKNYKTVLRTPVEFDYRGYHIITMPLPGSGGVLLPQMLKMLENFPLSQYGFHSARSVQLITEVERRAYADRAAYLGDPGQVKVPVKTLTGNAYLKQRMQDFDSAKAGKSVDIKPGFIKESEQTTHISIIDKDGNCVAVTTTLNGLYGSKCVVTGAGFLLNNEMDDFSISPGIPNQYGALGGKANAIKPYKRMLSSMSPTIVFKDKSPFMVVGSPGGTTIITTVLQTLINIIDFKMSAPDAVNKPKFHHQWLPDRIDVEKDFPDSTRKILQHMGYLISDRNPWSRTELILRESDHNYIGVADSRGEDDAE